LFIVGYLAFRESEPVVELLSKIIKEHPDKAPDVLLVDGNGMLHPQKSGLACHIGIKTGIPAIGVAKTLHLVEGIGVTRHMLQGMASMGDYILIRDNENEVLGMVSLHFVKQITRFKKHIIHMKVLLFIVDYCKTLFPVAFQALKTAKDTKNPMYISIGHKISLETAKNVVLKCSKYKIPEPIRFADNISREFVRKMEEKSQSEET